ncbi:Protein N-acetyltransferase, RimJ/RimL family [Haladaptatus litoreus]|uniref:Protein N-acetyltransferase, RimJ/RimL family n=1 Tax=Haladaptatus litoreus TaxID=553468 RepID=A0A1N7BZJ3_9EURY|nr:GNAT family protein [Haladaptatus litoreus]SIR56735.1 Protein N-acetyltransferase, RimJ/RimL family [Haladaptatus litoreus]
MPGPIFTTGDHVSLHPIEEEDHEFVQYGRNHPEIRVPLFATTIQTSDDVAEMLNDSEYRFLICRSKDGDPEPVGVIAFAWVWDETKVGSLMYWVVPEHHGNGYATEAATLFLNYAFRERGFHKVNAEVDASNAASAAVLEKLGFEREGIRRQENFVDGDWKDAHMYGLLADEWIDD